MDVNRPLVDLKRSHTDLNSTCEPEVVSYGLRKASYGPKEFSHGPNQASYGSEDSRGHIWN